MMRTQDWLRLGFGAAFKSYNANVPQKAVTLSSFCHVWGDWLKERCTFCSFYQYQSLMASQNMASVVTMIDLCAPNVSGSITVNPKA